jgi:hypothetical protein
MANGAELELFINPLYDDREINFEIDPVTGYPMESQRITFLDFNGDGEGGTNIQLCTGQIASNLVMYMVYIILMDQLITKQWLHSGDYYEMHVQKQCGVHIEDVSRCGELILSRN